MCILGFSTGALVRGDFALGIEVVRELGLNAIELSALREEELQPLVDAVDTLALDDFKYVSVHAPSKLERLSEEQTVESLSVFASKGWPVVVHPDVMVDVETWAKLGDFVCLENMDQRKPTGRTAAELRPFFEKLPRAKLCLDLAHAAQIDPTMTEAAEILSCYSDRLIQLHVSSIDGDSNHGPITRSSFLAFQPFAAKHLSQVPWILESVVPKERAGREVALARSLVSV